MKKLTFLTILLLIGGTVGKNYLIYSKIQEIQNKNPDRFKIDSLSWDWKGVYTQGIHITPKSSPDLVYLITETTVTHEWLSPLQLRLKAQDITGPDLQITGIEGGFSYWADAVSSTNLVIHNADIDMKRGKLLIPLANIPFTYHLNDKKLDLDATIPSSNEGTFKNIALDAKGSLVLSPLLNGKLDVHVAGVSKLIEALVEADVIKKKKAVFFEFGAKLLGGGSDESTLPLSFDQGNIYLGPVLIYEKPSGSGKSD